MPRLLLIVSFLCLNYGLCSAQYFQQDIKYDITASYDKGSHTLTGNTAVRYTNNAPAALDTIYLHLWANAFKSQSSPYAEQQLKLGNTQYYFAKESQMGGYQDITVLVDGKPAELKYGDSEDVAYVLPSTPLPAGGTASIEVAYTLRMPYLFDRLGRDSRSLQLVHWYPSVAVYDAEGWHPMPYLAMGEHYPSVADYKVNLSLPYEHSISTGPIDGSSAVTGITDFAVVATDVGEVLTDSYGDYTVSLLHYDNEVMQSQGLAIAKDVIDYMEATVGPYPHSSLAISEQWGPSGMEYGALVTVSGDSEEQLRYLIAHEVIHQWFYSGVVTDQRRYAWMDEGFTTYYQRRYYAARGYEDHYASQLPPIHGKQNGTLIQQYLAEMQAKRKFDQPLCTHVHDVSTINYGFNNYEVAARWLSHLEQSVGRLAFDQAIAAYFAKWTGKHPQPADLQQQLAAALGQEATGWFFEAMGCGPITTDYKISRSGDQVLIRNQSNLVPPYELSITMQDGTTLTKWLPPSAEQTITLSPTQSDDDHTISIGGPLTDIKQIKIGPDDGLLDHHRSNNSIGSKPIKLVPVAGLDDDDYSELYALPLVNYNTSDGVTAGAVLYNTSIAASKWKWLVAPQYGFQSGRLVGQAWTSYDHYLDSDRFRKLYFRLGLKSYGEQYIESVDQSLQYVKIDPSASVHFRHAADSHVYSKLTLKGIFITNEEFDFAELALDSDWSAIQQLRYERYDFDELSPSDIIATLEHQSYINSFDVAHRYVKLTAAYRKSWLYSPEKKVSFRLWGSYFLTNSQRGSSSYDRELTRGSAALIHQGYNDYAYEEAFYNRYNQDVGLWGRQVSNVGGGFKVPLGSQYNVGLSNDLALALNFEADIPIRTPKFLPLGVFLDLGHYREKMLGTDQNTGRTLYSGGLALNYGEGLFSIYIPLVQSAAIGDIYAAEGTNLLGRISFRLDLNRFNPWEIAEDYNF